MVIDSGQKKFRMKSTKEKIIKLCLVLFIFTSIIFLVDIIVFLITSESIRGYLFERFIYLYSLAACFYFVKSKILKPKIRIYLVLLFGVLLASPIFYINKCLKLGSRAEIKLNDQISLRESISIETAPAISLYKHNYCFEKEVSHWIGQVRIDNKRYFHLSEIDSARIINQNKNKILVQFYKSGKSEITEFELKNDR